LVDRNVPLFEKLYAELGISADLFIRTTDQKMHWPTVKALWEKLQRAGALEKRTYTGLYCTGCERFMTKRDLIDGNCVIHQRPPEEVKEENWFFLLAKKQVELGALLSPEKGSYRIVPSQRAEETMTLLKSGLEDVSFSRPKSSLSWGIPVPGDEEQTMYVWCDALTNYISGLGYFTDHEEREWWEDGEVTHVIGKDIARFHALIWPAMLSYAEVRTPDRLLIHGFLTSEGQKMSKSIGNVVAPQEVIDKFGVEPLRFYLSHEIPVGNDGDFSWKRFEELYDSKLRNALGNLLNRVLVLLKKDGGVLSVPAGFGERNDQQWKAYEQAMDNFEMHLGIQEAFKIVDECNLFIDVEKPWSKKGDEKAQILGFLAERLRFVTLMLLPFIPGTAQRIATQLNLPLAGAMLEKTFVISPKMQQWGSQKDWKTVGEPSILFMPLTA
jgi:methionyl-tRNA synthetase